MNFSHRFRYFLLVGLFALMPMQSVHATTIGTDVSVSGNFTLGGITGILQAINGLVSASSTVSTAFGGTGIATIPSYGQVLVGNNSGTYTLTSTSSLGIASGGSSQWTLTNTNITNNNSGVVVVGGTPTTFDPSQASWVAWIRADDLAGSDNTALTSVPLSGGSASTFTGTATLRTGSNGINGHNAIQFNGTSDALSNTSGGESMTGDFYAAAVVKFNNLSGFQNIVSWGDQTSGNGSRRSLMKGGGGYGANNGLLFIGDSADLTGAPATTAMNTTSIPYFVEMQRSGSTITLWIDGTEVTSGDESLISYMSNALHLGVNDANGEFLNGLISEAFFNGSTLSSQTQNNLRSYIASRYDISMNGLGVSPLPTFNNSALTFSIPAEFSVYGALAADAGASQHIFSNNYPGGDSLYIWNKSAVGDSAIDFAYPTDGQPMGAIGYAPPGIPLPWGGGTYGANYWEFSDFHDTGQFGILRLVQTGPIAAMRFEIRQDGDMVFYNQKQYSDPAFAQLLTIQEGGNVGIGTSTPNSLFHVSAGPSATTTVEFGDQYSTDSKTCFNVKNTAGAAISFYFVGTSMVVENNRCR